jgi:hypothetical protein
MGESVVPFDSAAETPGEPLPTMDDVVVTTALMPLEGSGVIGTVEIDGTGAQPVVTVTLTGATEGTLQGHIHGGTCADRTGAIMPLEPVEADASGSGQSTTTVDIPLATLMDGRHIVVYHEAGGSPGASVACAEIPGA